jgi:hypothetical protein
MNFIEFLRSEANRLNDTAHATENGNMWVGDPLTPSKSERMEAADRIRQAAKLILEIAERNERE